MVKIDTASLDDGRSLSRFMKQKEGSQLPDDQKTNDMKATTKSLAAVSARHQKTENLANTKESFLSSNEQVKVKVNQLS